MLIATVNAIQNETKEVCWDPMKKQLQTQLCQVYGIFPCAGCRCYVVTDQKALDG